MSSLLSLFSVPATQPSAAPAVARNDPSISLDQAFVSASQATGLPFDYFMTTAMRESSLDPQAAAQTSSARGLFQFIEQTWLGMMHQHGEALGRGQEASAIERLANGRFAVDDPQAREAVLDLRYDPQLSAVMSGLFLMENAQDLENALGRQVTVGEGYVAHVFGSGGASRLISLAEQQPNRIAADVFPTQAAANRGLFYDRSGEPVSVRQLYDRLVDGFPSQPVQTGVSVAAAPAVQPDQAQPVQLEPDGFDALPQSVPVSPDRLAQLGMFSAAGSGAAPSMTMASVPFFAGLYSPDGLQPTELLQEAIGTHGGPGSIGTPLDLIDFVDSGRLSQAYQNPARPGTSSDVVPPV